MLSLVQKRLDFSSCISTLSSVSVLRLRLPKIFVFGVESLDKFTRTYNSFIVKSYFIDGILLSVLFSIFEILLSKSVSVSTFCLISC